MSSPEEEAMMALAEAVSRSERSQTPQFVNSEPTTATDAEPRIATDDQASAQSRHKRKRSQKDDEPRHKKSKKKAKKKSSETRTRIIKVDSAYYNDNTDPICPMPQDFDGTGALERGYYHWIQNKGEKKPSENDDGPTAAPASVPDPEDDDLYTIDVEVEDRSPRKNKSKKRSKKFKEYNAHKESQAKKEDEPASKEEELPLPPPPDLMHMPPEVVTNIMRYLLVGETPVLVFAGWKKTYHRGQPMLHTSILAVLKRFYFLGCLVLYGENTFLYRLRDAPLDVPDLEELNRDEEMIEEGDASASDAESNYDAGDEEEAAEAEDDSDGEYQPGASGIGAPRRPRPARCPQVQRTQDRTIDIEKFRPLIRHIIVEAEHNRFSQGQKLNMARAIQAFIPPPKAISPGSFDPDLRPNINTLTIRVWPMLISDTTFSFVDFFAPEGPIVAAVKALECQHLRIEVKARYLVPDGMDQKSKRYRLDMRNLRMWQRADAGLADWWRTDLALRENRRNSAVATARIVESLQKIVLGRCKEDGPTLRYDPETDALFFVWEDLPELEAE